MLHFFKYPYKGRTYHFIWDIESGSLLNVDAAAFLVAKKKYTNTLTQEEQKDFFKIPASQKNDIENEFNDLEIQQLINAPPPIIRDHKNFGELKAMCLLICQDCNMRCKYCFADDGKYHNSDRSIMSLETGKKAIDYLIEKSGNRRNLEVDFFGGEPLMNFNVVKGIVDYARVKEKEFNKTFYFTLTTNCLALTDDVINYLNKEMHNVVLSIDGRQTVHNNMRKTANYKDSHATVLKNAMKFASVRGEKSYYVRGTFTKNNLDFAEDVKFLALNGFKQISLEPVVTDIKDLEITKEDIPRIEKEYEKLAYEYLESRKQPETWYNFFHFYVDLNHGPCMHKRMTGCGAGCEYISVATNGDIYPCHQFTNIKESKIGNVYEGSFNIAVSKQFSKNVVVNKLDCTNCFAKYYCSGGCAANNQIYKGNINIPYDITCAMMKKRFELALFINAIESAY